MRIKVISSLEKCFPDESVREKAELKAISLLKNERYSFQVCYEEETLVTRPLVAHLEVESPLKEHINLYKVKCIPSLMPCYDHNNDDNYLRTEPGLYPDLLEPMPESERIMYQNQLGAIWFEIDPKGEVAPGTYPVKIRFRNDAGEIKAEAVIKAEIIGAELPEQELIYTQWFHADCLMQYYKTGTYDEEHWRILENFIRHAARYGQTMILTPALSPELDTYIGGYRPSTQLTEITVKKGKYTFDFTRLGKWVDLCDKAGIKYFEINHFFSQWGAKACPQVWATVDGEYKRIFGWDTPSDGDEYKSFLGQFVPAMLSYLKKEKNGADKRCWFHISDEPSLEHIEQYERCSAILKPLVKGYPIMDALSKYDFYEKGLVSCPVPSNDHIQPFLDHKVPNLWTYYCCGQHRKVSNRFFAMPSARNRIIGVQFYKFDIAGFLQWGYNFYSTQYSYRQINPFQCSDAEFFTPSGDAYSVYPGTDGTPWPSLRQVVFGEALQDLRALKLCEELCGKKKVMKFIEDGIDPITFENYPHDAEYLLRLRRNVNAAIKRAVRRKAKQAAEQK